MIRVALVGAGQIARKVYLPVLWSCRDVELSVLVEPDDDRRQQVNRAFRFSRAVASVEEISPGQVDCAFVLTKEDCRREPLTRLFQLGVDVFCEKPLAPDLPQAEQFAELAQQRGRTLMVGFNRRFMPAYVKVKQFLRDRRIEMCRVKKQGANLMNHTIHMLDVLRWFCGEPVHVQADGNFHDGRETAVAAMIRFDSGALGIFETSANFGRRMEELEAHGQGFTVFVDAPDTAVMCADGREQTYRHGKDAWYMPAEQHFGFTDEVRHFLDAVQTHKVPDCSAADAIKTHRLAFEILAKLQQPPRADYGE